MCEGIKFEYYVLNEDFNKHKIEPFNIFRNQWVNEMTAKAVKKYLRNPSKFCRHCFGSGEPKYGFDGFVEELNAIIMCEEWGRCEYEIVVGGLFNDDKLEKWDCYEQCKPNMEMIAREVIHQYKKFKKEQEKK